MAELTPSLTPSTRPLLKAQIKLAAILSLSAGDFSKLIDEVEESPLFKKLFNSAEELKAIHRQKFTRAGLSQQFYDLPDNIPQPASTADVEKILQSKRNLVGLIRKIGRENFEKYFLYSNGEAGAEEISRACKIEPDEIEKINQLLTKVYVSTETVQNSSFLAGPHVYYTKVAQILPNAGNDFLIAFNSPRMAQGMYRIDYEKIKELKKKGALSKEEKAVLRALLLKINLINVRKNSLYQLILKITEFQRDFMSSEKIELLKPLTQIKIAQALKLSPSSISRLVANRSVESPNGKEHPLEFFFCSQKRWLKIRLERIFDEYYYLTDTEIAAIIKKDFGIALSRRSINQYRNEMR